MRALPPRNRVRFFLALMAALLGASAQAQGASASGCGSLLESDRALRERVPPRLRRLLEADRTVRWFRTRNFAWAEFHDALDRGLQREGISFYAKIDRMKAVMSFRRSSHGQLQLWIESLNLENTGQHLGSETIARQGNEFLDFLGAQLEWLARKRASRELESLEIVGENLMNAKLIELLESLEFVNRRTTTGSCIFAVLSGGLVGALGSILFSEMESFGIPHVAGTTAVGAATVAYFVCGRKIGQNFHLVIDPITKSE